MPKMPSIRRKRTLRATRINRRAAMRPGRNGWKSGK
jgi:hypothetical protein